jgi:hypothetical protein
VTTPTKAQQRRRLTRLFPEEFKSSLPTIEEIETELKNSQ